MSEIIKVLNINFDSTAFGGVTVFLINVYHHIDHAKIQIDFLTPDKSSFYPWRSEIESTGGNIYEFHINVDSRKGKRRFGKQLKSFLADHAYDIVHINSGVASFDCIVASAAKSQGVKVIVHSHNNGGRSWWKNLPVFFMKRRMQRKADVLCACSTEAARNIFTPLKVRKGEVVLIKNGIDLEKFRYDSEIRKKMRQDLNIENCFVVGHIGRFVEQKNHEFLIDIFAEVLREKPEAVLLLIGEGKLEENIREKVRNLNMENNVMFLGQRNDAADLYQAMDVFVFPSLFEGLGIVLVEAQMSGLPCFISDVVPNEVDFTNLINRISLQRTAKEWADEILASDIDIGKRTSCERELADAGYSIQNTVSQITHIYDSLMQTEDN